MEYTFTSDWFSPNIPRWERWLAEFRGRPNLRALEIGSYEGRSAIWLLENVLTDPSCVVECIDLFEADYRENFRANMALWPGRMVERAGRSFDQLRLAQGPYDIVYIDGSHWAADVLSDALMAWPLLRTGGVMIFDDYLWLNPEAEPDRSKFAARLFMRAVGRQWRYIKVLMSGVQAPKLGVDCFFRVMKGRYELLGREYQVAVRKIG